MLVAISETVLLRWRESPDFNLLLVTFVKEVEVRETTCARGDGKGKGRSRDSRCGPSVAGNSSSSLPPPEVAAIMENAFGDNYSRVSQITSPVPYFLEGHLQSNITIML